MYIKDPNRASLSFLLTRFFSPPARLDDSGRRRVRRLCA